MRKYINSYVRGWLVDTEQVILDTQSALASGP